MSDLKTWRDEISEQVGQLMAEARSTNQNVNQLRQELFGNGQPGKIAVMESRLGKLQRLVWIAYGFMAGGGLWAVVAILPGDKGATLLRVLETILR